MRREAYAAYSPADHVRIQLGISETRCTPPNDVPGISVRFTITANLNAANAPVLKTKALEAVHRGHAFLAIDLAACPYADATGLGVLISIANSVRRVGGQLTIEYASDDLVTVFKSADLSKVFTISHPVTR